MFDALVWLIPLAPLLGAAVALVVAGLGRPQYAHLPVAVGLAASFASAAFLHLSLPLGGSIVQGYNWLDLGGLNVDLELRVDGLSIVMLLAVTFVSTLVVLYSKGYMHGDPGYVRFFAVVALFVFAMTMLVLSENLLGVFLFWEGVGVCSYLLVGHWH
ncbi:MAG: NADH-quinone oxidoreductase subunit L, partial [Planctomycetia bacterium]